MLPGYSLFSGALRFCNYWDSFYSPQDDERLKKCEAEETLDSFRLKNGAYAYGGLNFLPLALACWYNALDELSDSIGNLEVGLKGSKF